MRVFITGIAGVLGSSLARVFVQRGYKVVGNDIARVNEAWRIPEEVMEKISYKWKSTIDLSREDFEGVDVVVDCGIGFADRPFGINSPYQTLIGNMLPPLRVLEIVRHMPVKPVVIYPSSFNALYGGKSTFTEETLTDPASLYGWTKGAVELMYRAYYRSYRVPVIITRVGSCFGPAGRSDELRTGLSYTL